MNEKLTNKHSKDKSFYLNILKDQPNNYEAILKLGLIDVSESNFLDAKKKFEKLLKIPFSPSSLEIAYLESTASLMPKAET